MTYRTFKLDNTTWDILLDANGNLAITETPEAVSQDVASACLVFAGECFYNTTLGIPWQEEVLGLRPTAGYIARKLATEAEKLPVVKQAIANIFFDESSRQIRGLIRITDHQGDQSEVSL